jgi:hypothetical protein
MSIIQKIFFDPKHRKRGLILAFAIFGICIALISGTLVYHFVFKPQTFPEFKIHPDLLPQQMQSFTDSQQIEFPNDESGFKNSKCHVPSGNWISQENSKPGVDLASKQWRAIDFRSATGSALWLDKTSVSCGESVNIHAALYLRNSDGSGDKRTFHALRIGWYGGAGARDVWSSKAVALKRLSIRQPKNNLRMVDTKWPTSIHMDIGLDWAPGFYLIASESASGIIENVAPLIVRSPLGTSPILLSHSFLTWNVYNQFGGRSGYFGSGGNVLEQRNDRSRVISLDRPMVGSGGFSIHRDAVSMVQFLEKSGINYDQDSDINLDEYPSIIKSYNEVILSGHAEYMTRRIFDSMIAARNQGINLAIFGGNTAVWQTRLTQSPIGRDRRIIMYRNSTQDPVINTDQITIQFRNSRVNTPQTLFTGTVPTGTHVYGDFHPIKIPNWLKIPANSSIKGISPDTEIEASQRTSPASPPNIQTIFSGRMTYTDPSDLPNGNKIHPLAEVIWFVTPNGQITFNAGFTTWACNLVDTCAYATVDENSRQVLDDVTKQVIIDFEDRNFGSKVKP